MSAFREHFLDKYFGYRRRYVDYVAREAPAREALAVSSEVVRLGFVASGSALCGLIFWLLTAGAVARAGGLGLWPVVFGTCGLIATAFVALALAGVTAALGDARGARPPSSSQTPL